MLHDLKLEKRRIINIGDTIRFVRISNPPKYLFADVIKIEIFKNWYDCYAQYFEEDFKDRYKTIEEVVDDTYNGGYYTKEDSDKYGCCCITLSNIRNKK